VTHRRDLGIVAAAALASATGDLAAVSALAVHLQRETGSGVVVAALFAANWLALAVGAPWGGALADRRDARRLLAVASILQAALCVALAGTTGTAGVLGLTALLGVGAAVAVPAEFALVGTIAAAGGGAGSANARVETARNLGYALGPLAGAGCVAAAGVSAALLLDAASFVLVAVAAGALRERRRPAPVGPKPRARDGVTLILADRTLRITVAALVGSLLAMSASISADVFFASSLGHGAWGLGLLLTGWTTGMVAGALAAGPRIPPRLLAVAAVAAAGLQGAGKLGAAAIGLLLPALLLYAVGGAVHGVKNVAARTLIHERIHPSAHGRAFAAYAAMRNGGELAALALGGVLVDAAGGRGTLVLSGAAAVAVAVVGLATLASPVKRSGAAWVPWERRRA
jgi:MFS family permease